MTDTKSEARFSLDDVIVIRTPNDCKMCERRVNTYVENVKDWQRQYDKLVAKLSESERRLGIAREALEGLYKRHLWMPGVGECICEHHILSAEVLSQITDESSERKPTDRSEG